MSTKKWLSVTVDSMGTLRVTVADASLESNIFRRYHPTPASLKRVMNLLKSSSFKSFMGLQAMSFDEGKGLMRISGFYQENRK